MMPFLFLAAILFAIPTGGVSLIAFIVFFVGKHYLKGKSRAQFGKQQAATRAVVRGTTTTGARERPTWLDTSDEEVFFSGVSKLAVRYSVPFAYVAHGFASPDSSAVLFKLAAEMEARGASFTQQQLAAADFIRESWTELDQSDKQLIHELDRKTGRP